MDSFLLAGKRGADPQTSVLETDIFPVKLLSYMVGMKGVEPSKSWSQAKCLTVRLHPVIGVSFRIRT